MCNELHRDSKPIPKTGTAWKLFRKNKKGELRTFCQGTSYDKKGKVIKYYPSMYGSSDFGFCGFSTMREAKRALQDWINSATWHAEENKTRGFKNTIVKVKYKQGLGTHIETHFCSSQGYQIVLFKQFEVCNE